jgi:hypothetical protein
VAVVVELMLMAVVELVVQAVVQHGLMLLLVLAHQGKVMLEVVVSELLDFRGVAAAALVQLVLMAWQTLPARVVLVYHLLLLEVLFIMLGVGVVLVLLLPEQGVMAAVVVDQTMAVWLPWMELQIQVAVVVVAVLVQ